MHKLSAVMITFNEELRIKKTLQSLAWCDEIIVVDSGSTDKTIEICKEFKNCKTFNHTFSGYGEQKRVAVEYSSNDWVLSVDGDEVVTMELKTEIQNILNKEHIAYSNFYIPITLVFLGKVFKYGNESKKLHLRLFNKKNGNFNDAKLHEKLDVSGASLKLTGALLHNSYKNIHHYFEKFNSYTDTGAKIMVKNKRKVSRAVIMIKFPFAFFKIYILNLNFLNGYEGYIWSMFSAFYKIAKYAKFDELISNQE
jgi:glycosyltransferase involved in cell wall biosynthesis